jgi:hypothetical protein
MAYRNYSTAVSHIVDTNGQGDFTTIGAALTAASSGQTIFIRPGTYTENLTLKAGVNLSAYGCDLENNVIINGKCTFTAAGTVSMSGIQLQTNSDFCLAVTGSAASIVDLNGCYINASNNTGISFSTSSGSAQINLFQCQGNLGTTGIALFTSSSAGSMNIRHSVIGNTGASTTASSASAGTIDIKNSFLSFALSTSSTATIFIQLTNIDTSAINTTSLTANGTGGGGATNSLLQSGTASTISIGTGVTYSVYNCSVSSTNTNAITGAGTLGYGGIDFFGSSTTINTTTQLPVAYSVPQGGTGASTFTSNGVLYGNATGALQVTTQGASHSVLTANAGSPSFSASPQITALGIGAAAGASGLTFDGTNLLGNYVAWTSFTPTLTGASTAGTTTYSSQTGNYSRIGNIAIVQFDIVITAATGTGNLLIGNLPFTINGGNYYASAYVNNFTWPTSTTQLLLSPQTGTTTSQIVGLGSGNHAAFLQIANVTGEVSGVIVHRI